MGGFFQALSEFLESDLAKSHGWTIAVAFIICCFIVGFIVWFVMYKVILRVKFNEASDKTRAAERNLEEFAKLKDENAKLKDENEKLKKKLKDYKFEALSESSASEECFVDRALEKFVIQGKKGAH